MPNDNLEEDLERLIQELGSVDSDRKHKEEIEKLKKENKEYKGALKNIGAFFTDKLNAALLAANLITKEIQAPPLPVESIESYVKGFVESALKITKEEKQKADALQKSYESERIKTRWWQYLSYAAIGVAAAAIGFGVWNYHKSTRLEREKTVLEVRVANYEKTIEEISQERDKLADERKNDPQYKAQVASMTAQVESLTKRVEKRIEEAEKEKKELETRLNELASAGIEYEKEKAELMRKLEEAEKLRPELVKSKQDYVALLKEKRELEAALKRYENEIVEFDKIDEFKRNAEIVLADAKQKQVLEHKVSELEASAATYTANVEGLNKKITELEKGKKQLEERLVQEIKARTKELNEANRLIIKSTNLTRRELLEHHVLSDIIPDYSGDVQKFIKEADDTYEFLRNYKADDGSSAAELIDYISSCFETNNFGTPDTRANIIAKIDKLKIDDVTKESEFLEKLTRWIEAQKRKYLKGKEKTDLEKKLGEANKTAPASATQTSDTLKKLDEAIERIGRPDLDLHYLLSNRTIEFDEETEARIKESQKYTAEIFSDGFAKGVPRMKYDSLMSRVRDNLTKEKWETPEAQREIKEAYAELKAELPADQMEKVDYQIEDLRRTFLKKEEKGDGLNEWKDDGLNEWKDGLDKMEDGLNKIEEKEESINKNEDLGKKMELLESSRYRTRINNLWTKLLYEEPREKGAPPPEGNFIEGVYMDENQVVDSIKTYLTRTKGEEYGRFGLMFKVGKFDINALGLIKGFFGGVKTDFDAEINIKESIDILGLDLTFRLLEEAEADLEYFSAGDNERLNARTELIPTDIAVRLLKERKVRKRDGTLIKNFYEANSEELNPATFSLIEGKEFVMQVYRKKSE